MGFLYDIGRLVHVLRIAGKRELDVHVELEVLRQQKGVVRAGRGGFLGLLLEVVYAFHKAGEAEHVLRHPLAPLAALLVVGEGALELVGRFLELAGLLGGRRSCSLTRPNFCSLLLSKSVTHCFTFWISPLMVSSDWSISFFLTFEFALPGLGLAGERLAGKL